MPTSDHDHGGRRWRRGCHIWRARGVVGLLLAFCFSPLSLIQIALGPLRVPTFSSFHSFPSTSMVHKPIPPAPSCPSTGSLSHAWQYHMHEIHNDADLYYALCRPPPRPARDSTKDCDCDCLLLRDNMYNNIHHSPRPMVVVRGARRIIAVSSRL